MFCAIWYHLYNSKNVKNTHGGVLLVKLQAFSTFSKSNTLPWVFFTLFKLYKWYQIVQRITCYLNLSELIKFYAPWNHKKTGFLMISRGKELVNSPDLWIEIWRWFLIGSSLTEVPIKSSLFVRLSSLSARPSVSLAFFSGIIFSDILHDGRQLEFNFAHILEKGPKMAFNRVFGFFEKFCHYFFLELN